MQDNRIVIHKETGPKSAMLSGNALALYLILLNTVTKTLKVEGRRFEWGNDCPYYEIIAIREGQLDYHMTFMPLELVDYKETQVEELLRFDNVNVSAVVQLLVSQKGLYRKDE